MGLNIKNQKTEETARALARVTGESLTKAIAVAVQERLDRVSRQHPEASAQRLRRIHEIGVDAAGRWKEPWRSSEHGDLLYDKKGLPS